MLGRPWWETGVLYQIYPRSFADANGDGIGDIAGIIENLDHLQWLGIDGIWISPIHVSPQTDFGYDVADYCGVDPAYGTLEELDQLISQAGERGIRVLLDLVPNHTSDQHPWFQAALADRNSPFRDFYHWADGRDGGAPNNWLSTFGGPAWTLDEASGQYYLHNFLSTQPDLNWWNPKVSEAFDEILRFWFDRGVAGFRIDVCNMVIKDKELRDNPPATEDDPLLEFMFGQRFFYNYNQPEVHDVIAHWRQIADSYDPPRLLVGETNVENFEKYLSYYGNGSNELHLAFNFIFIDAPLEAEAMGNVIDKTMAGLPEGAWPVWTGSNHDFSRLATRWAGGHAARARAALFMLLTLPGTPFLYQGDEIGLEDGVVEHEEMKDPTGLRWWPHYLGRDPERTPMVWSDEANGGFSPPGVTTWLPVRNVSRNVAAQRDEPGSILWAVHDLIEIRRHTPDLAGGSYERLDAPTGVLAYRRGEGHAVAINLSEHGVDVELGGGSILISTVPGRGGETVHSAIHLTPYEGVVLAAH